MREAGVTTVVLQRGLQERLLWTAWAGLCVGVGAVGLAMHILLAADAQAPLSWGVGFGVAALVAAAVSAWRSMPEAQWRLEVSAHDSSLAMANGPADARKGKVDPMMDLGRWVLLRFRDAESRRDTWLSASASRLGSGWHPLRAALFRPDRAAGAAARPA